MTYFSLLFRSFFSPDAYRHMMQGYKGSGFGYLFFMIAIITSVYVACALYQTQQWFFVAKTPNEPSRAQAYLYDIAQQMPEIIIEDGILSTEAEQPYIMNITFDDERFPIAVIDVDANPKDLLDEETPPILITADAVHGRDDNKIESYYFEEYESDEPFMLNAEIARELSDQLLTWTEENLLSNAAVLFLIFWAFFVIIWLIWATLVGLIWAVIVLITSKIMKHSFYYEDCLKLTFLILTPAYLIQTGLANLLRNDVPIIPGDGLPLIIYVGVLFLTTIFAISSLKRSEFA